MGKTQFAEGEYYHIYNRGVEKRNIFDCEDDTQRFLKSMTEFNVADPIGSIYANQFKNRDRCKLSTPSTKFAENHAQNKKKKQEVPLVEFIAYCLNPNHYHFILRQVAEDGVSRFLQRLAGGYTRYFNEKYDRTGVLFQGGYKAAHIDTNEKLLRLSAYVNLNFDVHQLSTPSTKLVRSSWEQYRKGEGGTRLCETSIILDQFRTTAEYRRFAHETVADIVKQRREEKDVALPVFE